MTRSQLDGHLGADALAHAEQAHLADLVAVGRLGVGAERVADHLGLVAQRPKDLLPPGSLGQGAENPQDLGVVDAQHAGVQVPKVF